MLAAKSQHPSHPSYDTMQDNGQLCDSLPELYKDCNKLFGAVYEEFSPDLECDVVTGDQVFCATPYSQVVDNLCENGCPKSETEFVELFSLLASCGYLESVGGAPALDSPEAATACLAEQGACQRKSPNSLFKYSKCRLPMKQLMFDGAKFIGLQAAMKKPDDCDLNKLLPKERCDAVFGFQVKTTYCRSQSSTAGQLMGASVLSSLLGVWVARLLSHQS
jgi:hypothetical protein